MSTVKCARVNGELWQSDLTNSLVVGMENVTNYCWFAGILQRWGIQFTPSACYTRSSKQTLCVGLEVDKTEAMIRNRYNRIPHPALNTKPERMPTMKTAPKQKQHKRKAKWGSSFEGQRIFEERGKTESRAYDELLQVKWPKEDEPLFLYFLIELIQKSQ